MQELILDFGLEGCGEKIFLDSTENGEHRIIRKFSHIQLDIDDWKIGEEYVPSLEFFWDKFTKDPKWYRFHPRVVHDGCRSMVIHSLQKINLKTITQNEKDSVDEWMCVTFEGKYTSDSIFKNKCRFYQSRYRADNLKVWFDEDLNILRQEDGQKGLNFYDGFGIREAVRKIPFRKPLYCNLLRSEHIPFNFFHPLNQDKDFCKEVFNAILENIIIDRITHDIVIEYAPEPKEDYLNDHTSFDTYIEYQHKDGSMGILGIEVKYTEGSYPLKKGTTEYDRMNKDFNESKYKKITEKSGIFQLKAGDFDQLKLDRNRQVWRNHLLGESILLEEGSKYQHFHSLTFYPSGNIHFTDVISEYRNRFLKPDYQDRVRGVTYEQFFESCRKYCPNQQYRNWIEYLEKRYLL